MSTKITIENQYGVFTVELNDNLISLDQYLNELVKPCLQSAGFVIDGDLEIYEDEYDEGWDEKYDPPTYEGEEYPFVTDEYPDES